MAGADGGAGEGEVVVKAKAGGNLGHALGRSWSPHGPRANGSDEDEPHRTAPHANAFRASTSARRPDHWACTCAASFMRALLPPPPLARSPIAPKSRAGSSGANVKADAKFTRLAALGTAWPVPRAPAWTARTLVNPRPLPLPSRCQRHATLRKHTAGAVPYGLHPPLSPPSLLHVRTSRIALPANRLRRLLPFAPCYLRPPSGETLDAQRRQPPSSAGRIESSNAEGLGLQCLFTIHVLIHPPTSPPLTICWLSPSDCRLTLHHALLLIRAGPTALDTDGVVGMPRCPQVASLGAPAPPSHTNI
jgi:hypothetical protein